MDNEEGWQTVSRQQVRYWVVQQLSNATKKGVRAPDPNLVNRASWCWYEIKKYGPFGEKEALRVASEKQGALESIEQGLDTIVQRFLYDLPNKLDIFPKQTPVLEFPQYRYIVEKEERKIES